MATKYERRIEALTSEVALSRTRIQRRMAELEEQLDVSQRVRNELSAHPFKWLALSAAGGFVASKLLPVAFRFARRSWVTSLLAPAARIAIAAAAPAIVDSISRRVGFVPPSVHEPRTLHVS